MSSTLQTSISASDFQVVFNTALVDYARQTGNDIATHPLAAKLKYCDSPDSILAVLHEQAKAFDQFRKGDWKVEVMRRLKPTVHVVLALSAGVFGEGVGLVSCSVSYDYPKTYILQVFSPAKAIFAGIGILLTVCSSFLRVIIMLKATSRRLRQSAQTMTR